jgi:hypothetical protein
MAMRTYVFILTIIACVSFSSIGNTADQCRNLFSIVVDRVYIPDKAYDHDVKQLRATLTGKLATVWRSEWKTKLAVKESNHYVLNLVNKFLSPETQKFVLDGLNMNSDGFTREIHARLWDLQQKNQLRPGDELAVRDSPPPQGARDTTFTFYTKPISSSQGDGKHQVRLRTYLREIKPSKIAIGANVQGFDMQGNLVTVSRIDQTLVRVTKEQGGVITTDQTLTLQQLYKQGGTSVHLFAPHGKTFKLEIKTALNDEISGQELPLLAGKHMVQKLDVALTPSQVARLFAPLKGTTNKEKYQESLLRVNELSKELIEITPDNKPRIEAVFEVLREGLANSDFLKIEGATAYHRTAFETTTGLQTTIDRDQGVYVGNMYTTEALKSPIYMVQYNEFIKTKLRDARHVELKVPVTSMANTVGITFADPASAPQPQNPQNDERIKQMAAIYHQFVKNAFHSGKFNYIRENGDLGD